MTDEKNSPRHHLTISPKVKLLTATTRYYLLLTTVLFALASGLLYAGVNRALKREVDEDLRHRARTLSQLVARGQPLPDAAPGEVLLTRARQPRALGYADTLLREPFEKEPVPYRQLTFRLGTGAGAQWLTLRRSLVETEDVLSVVLEVMLGVLALLLLGVVGLNRWLSSRLWAPFRRTLTTLRSYELARHEPLALPAPAVREFAELNQALNQLSQRLAADYESLRQFTENAAHELQTPLAIMQAQLEELLQVPALTHDEAAVVLVGELLAAARRLSRLHQALTLLSRLENRQFAPGQAVPVRLDQLLRERVASLQPLLEARALHLTLRVAEALPPLLLHPGLADSLLQNLLHNAIKHNHPGGGIEIELSQAALEIRNTGPVISGDPARFFERFRKHAAASDSPGLGLSIVQHIAGYYGFGVGYSFEAAGGWHVLRVAF